MGTWEHSLHLTDSADFFNQGVTSLTRQIHSASYSNGHSSLNLSAYSTFQSYHYNFVDSGCSLNLQRYFDKQKVTKKYSVSLQHDEEKPLLTQA